MSLKLSELCSYISKGLQRTNEDTFFDTHVIRYIVTSGVVGLPNDNVITWIGQ